MELSALSIEWNAVLHETDRWKKGDQWKKVVATQNNEKLLADHSEKVLVIYCGRCVLLDIFQLNFSKLRFFFFLFFFGLFYVN